MNKQVLISGKNYLHIDTKETLTFQSSYPNSEKPRNKTYVFVSSTGEEMYVSFNELQLLKSQN